MSEQYITRSPAVGFSYRCPPTDTVGEFPQATDHPERIQGEGPRGSEFRLSDLPNEFANRIAGYRSLSMV
jgi:hypothetical protein